MRRSATPGAMARLRPAGALVRVEHVQMLCCIAAVLLLVHTVLIRHRHCTLSTARTQPFVFLGVHKACNSLHAALLAALTCVLHQAPQASVLVRHCLGLHCAHNHAWRGTDLGAEVSPRRLSVDQRRVSTDPEAPLPDHETTFRRTLDHELRRINAFYEKKVQRKLHTSLCSC